MVYQTIFKRYEVKYLITKKQKEEILDLIKDYIQEDQYGKSVICNLYFDTPNYYLIRKSLEKPIYKEKFRLRSYGKANQNSLVYAEIKKKYDRVVYKRRIEMTHKQAYDYLYLGHQLFDTQISHEIDYFFDYYERLEPRVYLSYERCAFYGKEDHDLRITFDENILWRKEDLSLCSEIYGENLLEEDQVLMEVKTSKAIPLWLVELLSQQRIYKTSFSKYGYAYQTMMNGGNYHGKFI